MSRQLQEAKGILSHLIAQGYEAYFVGGYVRNVVLGRGEQYSDDIDIATSAHPEEVMNLFPRAVPTGLQHGTVTVVCEHIACEVTTFRTESGYADFRRPDHVHFVDNLLEDLKRRDFTMNAMAMDVEGQVIDPFHGQEDLQRGVLRCVGDPQERFKEDALRMMRCIRFAAHYELVIEDETWQGLLQQKSLLKHIAVERQRVELEKMMSGPAPHIALDLLCQSDLLAHSQVDLGFRCEALCQVVDSGIGALLVKLEESNERWALLLLSLSMSAGEARRLLRQFTFAKRQIAEICQIIACHEQVMQLDPSSDLMQIERAWKLICLRHGETASWQWLNVAQVVTGDPLAIACLRIDAQLLDILAKDGQAWLANMPVRTLHDLNISGRDLTELRERRGAWIGQLLDQLLIEAALGEVANEHESLLRRAEHMMEEWMIDD